MGKVTVIDINRLVLGRTLDCPIHGTSGVLLVGAGTTLTAELKQKLLGRGVTKVVIDEESAANMTIDGIESKEFEALNEKLNERVEEFIRSGAMQMRNTGPALARSVVKHGAKAYDNKVTEKLTEEHGKNVEAASDMLNSASAGGEVELDDLDSIAGSGIQNLTGDFASTLSTAFKASGDQPLAEHAIQMSTLGMAIGIEIGYDFDNVRLIGIAGMLADLGMTGVPDRIRNAKRRLTDVEFVEIQKHSIRTANMLDKMERIPKMVQIIAYQLHERPDGSGYPRGRARKGIHPFALVLHVADAYVAMTSKRPDRPPLMPYCAMESLLQQTKENRIDGGVMRALLRTLSLFPIGSFVNLSDGCAARVIRANGPEYTQPIVIKQTDENGKLITEVSDELIVDLTKSDLEVLQALPAPGSNEEAVDVRGASRHFECLAAG